MKHISALLSVSFLVSGCMGGGGGLDVTQGPAPTLYPWMNPEIADAWEQGYLGQGSRITVVDEFASGTRFRGNLGTGVLNQRHGDWVALQASLIAPSASIRNLDFNTTSAVGLQSGQLNVLNLSYGVVFDSTTDVASISWSGLERSLIDYAFGGSAVIVKAAGNDGVAVDAVYMHLIDGLDTPSIDGLNIALIGAEAAIFVGALDANGTVADPASLASYSNFAGSNATIQGQFLTVGVPSDQMGGLAGTSFAAPTVSGYAAVIGSKFPDATPTQIANQLLNTARTDTILNYSPDRHGRGEASIARALAPASIR